MGNANGTSAQQTGSHTSSTPSKPPQQRPSYTPAVPAATTSTTTNNRPHPVSTPHTTTAPPPTTTTTTPMKPPPSQPQPTPPVERKGNQDIVKMLGKGALTDTYEVDLKTVLGKGHYAVVNLGRHIVTKEPVAIKRIQISRSRVEALRAEITTLSEIGKHPSVVELKAVYLTDVELILVLELLRGGELFERMERFGPCNEQLAKKYIKTIAEALRFLHAKGIVHRDLKPENIMLVDKSENSDIKIADFGLSKMVTDVKFSVMNTVCGTWAYASPEVKPNSKPPGTKVVYSYKVDMWSLGVIMYVILVAFHPFDPDNELSDGELWSAICRGTISFDDPAWKHVSANAKDLIRRLIVVDPEKRYDSEQVLAHPWLADVMPRDVDKMEVVE